MFGRKKKRTLLERLTGTINVDEYDEFEDEDQEEAAAPAHSPRNTFGNTAEENLIESTETADGQLAVDVFNTEDTMIVKAMIAGVRPSDMDIDIARDMVTIRGKREEEYEISENDYYHRELYWGTFSRNILLPEEVDVDAAEATEKNGLLTIRLPKLDKRRKAKLQVRSK